MRPYDGTQALVRIDPQTREPALLGSCFMLAGLEQHAITASHCVDGVKPSEIILALSLKQHISSNCTNIYAHPTADIAILKFEETLPKGLRRRIPCDERAPLGMHLQTYGFTADFGGQSNTALRCIEGVVQRHFFYTDRAPYQTPGLELSVPVPKGMSGAPSFFAQGEDVAYGVALGSIDVAVVDYQYENIVNGNIQEHISRERITEYGIVLDLSAVKEWLYDQNRAMHQPTGPAV